MEFIQFCREQLAVVVENGKPLDTVIVRDVEMEGQFLTVQSLMAKPGVMEEFIYLPQGDVLLFGTPVIIAQAGWRLLFWVDGVPNKCVNHESHVYSLYPVRSAPGQPARMQ